MSPEIKKTLYSIGTLRETGGLIGLFPDFKFQLKQTTQSFPEVFLLDPTTFDGTFFHFKTDRDLAQALVTLLNVVYQLVSDHDVSVLEFLAKSAIPYEWMLSILWQELVRELQYPTVLFPYPHRFDFNVVRFRHSERRSDRDKRAQAVADFDTAFGNKVRDEKVLVLDDVIDSEGTVGRMLYVHRRAGAINTMAMQMYGLDSPWWRRGQKHSAELGMQNPTSKPDGSFAQNPFIPEQLPPSPESIAFKTKIVQFAQQIASRVKRTEK